jgi:plastocyanin
MRLRLVHVVSGMLCAGPMVTACAGEEVESVARTRIVEIRDMAFHPAELLVNPGDTVVWVNLDFVPHTATAPDSAWTSPSLAQGERWSMVARTHGTRAYMCAFHPVMEARLTVDPHPFAEKKAP